MTSGAQDSKRGALNVDSRPDPNAKTGRSGSAAEVPAETAADEIPADEAVETAAPGADKYAGTDDRAAARVEKRATEVSKMPDGPEKDAAFEALHEEYADDALSIIHMLRGFYIKVGQIGSSRDDFVPKQYLKRLKTLQDDVPAQPFSVVQDIVKDELKAHIRNKIEEDPDLHAEIKEAVNYYFQQKARSVYAELKATRAATRLGLRLLPDELQGEVGEALIGLFEKELGAMLDKAL